MHLHGFYYRVDSRGTIVSDTIYGPAQQRQVVTERLSEGTTMTMTWSPERAGQWLMHCHLHFHVSPDSAWGPDYPHVRKVPRPGRDEHQMDDMAGLVLGINVTSASAANPERPVARRVRLVVEPAAEAPRIQVRAGGGGSRAGAGLVARGTAHPHPRRADRDHRGEPHGGAHRDALAWNRARQLLRRGAGMERHARSSGPR